MSTTIVVKANAIATHTFRTNDIQRKRPTIARLDAMRKCAELEIDLFSPSGEFLIDVLELSPKMPMPTTSLTKYDQDYCPEFLEYCDNADSSRFDVPAYC